MIMEQMYKVVKPAPVKWFQGVVFGIGCPNSRYSLLWNEETEVNFQGIRKPFYIVKGRDSFGSIFESYNQ